MNNKRLQFNTVELGTTYELPKYRVIDNKGIEQVKDLQGEIGSFKSDILTEITFVRGDKTDNGTIIPRVDGITHEQLLGVMIEDLQYKNSLVPSKETACCITKLQESLFWLEERQRNRELRNVNGTYNK